MRAMVESTLEIRNNRYEVVDLKDIYRGCSAFCVCGGPSLNQIPLEKLRERGCLSIGVNNAACYARTNLMTFNDSAQKFSDAIWLDPTVMKLAPHPRHSKAGEIRAKRDGKFYWTGLRARDCPNTFFFKRNMAYNPETFLTEDSASAGTNKAAHAITGRHKTINSMTIPLKLLFHFGVREVFILGADFHMTEEQPYAFGQSKWKGGCGSNNNAYHVLNGLFHELRPILEAAGMFVWNCNETSGLSAFDHVPFDKALERCRNGIPEGEPDLADFYDKSAPTLPASAFAEIAT